VRCSAPRAVALAAALAAVGPAAPARAATEDWQLNELLVSVDGDLNIRYVELRNDVGGCLFPTSRIEVRAGDGSLVGAVSPVAATTCYWRRPTPRSTSTARPTPR
jgi:hypothetical protein